MKISGLLLELVAKYSSSSAHWKKAVWGSVMSATKRDAHWMQKPLMTPIPLLRLRPRCAEASESLTQLVKGRYTHHKYVLNSISSQSLSFLEDFASVNLVFKVFSSSCTYPEETVLCEEMSEWCFLASLFTNNFLHTTSLKCFFFTAEWNLPTPSLSLLSYSPKKSMEKEKMETISSPPAVYKALMFQKRGNGWMLCNHIVLDHFCSSHYTTRM